MGTVGRVKNQHPGDASVHGGLGCYHVDIVSHCGLFCVLLHNWLQHEHYTEILVKNCVSRETLLLLVVFLLDWLFLGCFYK